MRPGRADRDAEVLGDPLGELARDVELAHRRLVAALGPGHGRDGELVGDARVVDAERGGKEAGADEAMRARIARRQHGGSGERCRYGCSSAHGYLFAWDGGMGGAGPKSPASRFSGQTIKRRTGARVTRRE